MSPSDPKVGPLGRRLSLWLAMQSLTALILVSLLVYIANALSLSNRQLQEMQLKRAAIELAVADAASAGNRSELQHTLDNYLSGHPSLFLWITGSLGDSLYVGANRQAEHKFESVAFALPWPADPAGRVDAVLSMDTAVDQRLLSRLALTLALASAMGAAVVSWTGFRLVRLGLAPVRELSAQVESIGLERASTRLDGAGQPLELLPLVEKFNALLARNERAYAQVEAFNADVAHELRTPLTALVVASELALQQARPATELREVIGANLEDLRRMSALVSDMLFLSNADHGAAARRTYVDSLAHMLTEITDFHEAAIHDAGLSVRVEGDLGGSADAGLLRRAVSNLLSNATRHAIKGSTIVVSVSATTDQRIRISVRNIGQTIPADQLTRLFDRFFRVESARQRTGPQHGLGLAIVAAIARMHAGAVFAESKDGITLIGMVIASK